MSLEKALELLDVAMDIQFKEGGLRLSLSTTRLALRQIIEYLQSSPTTAKAEINEKAEKSVGISIDWVPSTNQEGGFSITCPGCNTTTTWTMFGSDWLCSTCGEWHYWYGKGWVKEGANPFSQSSTPKVNKNE